MGGTRPRWNVHRLFQIPRRFFNQMVLIPKDDIYFSISPTDPRSDVGGISADRLLTLVLGSEIPHARRVVNADTFDT